MRFRASKAKVSTCISGFYYSEDLKTVLLPMAQFKYHFQSIKEPNKLLIHEPAVDENHENLHVELQNFHCDRIFP